MGATPTYLFRRRNGIYYFRTRIPSDLQPHFARSEISRSLKTRDPSAAIRLARIYIVQLQTAFDSIRDIHMRRGTGLIAISRTVQKGDKTETTEIKKDFHSFRHAVVDTLKQKLVDEKLINAIIGHAVQSMSTGRYGDPFHPRLLIDVIQQLDFEDCLSEVKPYLTHCKR
jgi:hypothetical protein